MTYTYSILRLRFVTNDDIVTQELQFARKIFILVFILFITESDCIKLVILYLLANLASLYLYIHYYEYKVEYNT